jgi:hypothetical protein
MEANKELKVGMKVRLRPYSEDLTDRRLIPGHPGTVSTMVTGGFFGSVVTVKKQAEADQWFLIEEDGGKWTWDVRWIAEDVVESVDCDDCTFNPNRSSLGSSSIKCWDCISLCGTKKFFKPIVDSSQIKGMTADVMAIDDPLPVSPMDTQVGGSHYKDMKIQPIQFAVANKLNSCQTLALRYLTRKKGGKEKVLEDRRKAIHVIEMEIEMITKGEIEVE